MSKIKPSHYGQWRHVPKGAEVEVHLNISHSNLQEFVREIQKEAASLMFGIVRQYEHDNEALPTEEMALSLFDLQSKINKGSGGGPI